MTTMTGMNPGGHGVFDFRVLDLNEIHGRSERFVRSSQYAGLTLFDFLGKRGLKVGAFNIPLTYPAWPINGVMVAGPITPDLRVAYTYPAELAEHIGPMAQHTDPEELKVFDIDRYLDELVWITERHFEYGRKLLIEHGVFDLFWFHLHSLDSVQHRFWQYSQDGLSPNSMEKSKHAGAIERLYRLADDGVGELLELLGSHSNVIVMSDHGAQARGLTEVRVNVWLQELGQQQVDNPGVAERTVRALRRRINDRWGDAKQASSSGSLNMLDQQRTGAFFFPLADPVGGIVINLIDRQPEGHVSRNEYEEMRETLIKDLKSWVNTADGRPIVKEIWKREQLYTGRYVENSPDILFAVDPRYYLNGEIWGPVFEHSGELKQNTWSGVHAMEGILIAKGPKVSDNSLNDEANLVDIAPTLLHLLDQPVPSNMNGQVLHNLLTDEEIKDYPKEYCDSLEPLYPSGQPEAVSGDESEAMARHLRALGYME